MKKPALLLSVLFLSLLLLGAAGGSAGDPLISLSFLEGTFTQTLEAAVNSRLDGADSRLRAAFRQLGGAAAGEESTLKEGDVLSGGTGMSVILLGGQVRLSGGPVVDVTAGLEAAPGQALEQNHRYIVAEDAVAAFTVDSPAAVVCHEGGGILARSSMPDYYAIACALRELKLFQGSGSGIGEGFDLYLPPTRGEGLVMFIRILGEEEDALACNYTHPFTDVPGWLDRYVAWAYAKGYANGVSPTQFGSGQLISAVEYEEFLLRALGYSVAGADDYSTSLERALNCGALTNGEYVTLQDGPFLRAHVAYVSYYALDTVLSGESRTLAQQLAARGVMTREQLDAAQAQVDSLRIY